MIDALLRLGLGIAISILAVAVLLPVTVVIARVFRWAIGGRIADRLCQIVGDGEWNRLLADKVETAIIGGLIGGIVFTSLSPAVAPAMYDLHVRSGIVDQPEPSVTVHQLNASDRSVSEEFGVDPGGNYSVYVVELSNENQRTLQNYNLNVRFPGCVAATAVGATNLDSAAVTNESQRVQVGEFANRSANATCYGAVGITEFAPGNSALVTFVVSDAHDPSQRRVYPRPEQPRTVYLADSFSWEYSGRSYYEATQLAARDVQTHRDSDR